VKKNSLNLLGNLGICKDYADLETASQNETEDFSEEDTDYSIETENHCDVVICANMCEDLTDK